MAHIFVIFCLWLAATNANLDNYTYYYENYHYNWYDYEFPNENDTLSIDKVELVLRGNDSQTFLSQFSEPKREVIRAYLLYCPYSPLCGFSLNVTIPPRQYNSNCRPCNCSDECVYTRVCCPDILPEKLFEATYSKDEPLYECPSRSDLPEEVKTTCEAALGVSNFQFDGSCRQAAIETDFNAKSMARGLLNNLQVRCSTCYEANDEGFVVGYKNILDFSCPAIQQSILPKDNSFLEELIADKGNICEIRILTDHWLLDNLCTISITTCNASGQWFEFNPVYSVACSAFYAPYLYYGVVYGNLFCLLCNGIVPDTLTHTTMFDVDSGSFSFAGLMQLDVPGSGESVDYLNECGTDEIYNIALGLCLKASCSPVRSLDNTDCIKTIDKLSGNTYDAFYRLFPEDKTDLGSSIDTSGEVLLWFKTFVNTTLQEYTDVKCLSVQISHAIAFNNQPTDDLTNIEALLEYQIDYIDIKLEFLVDSFHDPEMILQACKTLHGDSIQVDSVSRKFTVFLRDSLQDPNVFRDVPYYNQIGPPTERRGGIQIDGMFHSKDKHILIFLDSKFYDGWFNCGMPRSKSNVLIYNPCLKVLVDKTKVEWKETTGYVSITSMGAKVVLDSRDYLYGETPTLLMVCNDVLTGLKAETKTNASKGSDLELLLSMIVIPISIVSLIVTLLVYTVIDELRTPPGINLMTLSVVLIIAQSLYLIGSFSGFETHSVICKMFGMLIHFCWLMVIAWMNICTYHTFRVFVQRRLVRMTFKVKICLSYHLYGTLIPAICVALNVTISILTSNDSDTGYGSDICYIDSQRMLELTFGLPALLMILVNVVLFAMVVSFIKRSNRPVGTSKDRNDLIIFTKLSTIAGLMWVFGFLLLWTGYSAFSYLFIVFNGGQGVFICLSFTTNRRVYNSFKSKWLKTSYTSSPVVINRLSDGIENISSSVN